MVGSALACALGTVPVPCRAGLRPAKMMWLACYVTRPYCSIMHACWWMIERRHSVTCGFCVCHSPLLPLLAKGREPLLSSHRILVLEGSSSPPVQVSRESPFSNRVCSISNGSVELLKSGSQV